ncbi:MAG: uroporphyrinogen-III synthase, partial [Pseudomonadota bacterium]
AATAAEMADLLSNKSLSKIYCPPDEFNSETLLGLPILADVEGKNILIVRGRGGREHLASTLKDRGASVQYLEVYERELIREPLSAKLLSSGVQCPSIGVVTSVEALSHLAAKIEDENLSSLFEMRILTPGARIAREVPSYGFTKPPLIADNPTHTHIITRLERWITEEL